jgi:hypothetical protein
MRLQILKEAGFFGLLGAVHRKSPFWLRLSQPPQTIDLQWFYFELAEKARKI